ncbi:MAG: nucleotidyltransferase domain-containing protein [Acidobacteria bacterium]|nr:nucleotidyltransferase domain-containing protein [Acidobacteriota bacterium]
MDRPDSTALDTALRRTFDAAQGIVSAYFFGSTAEGRTHRESDLDIGVLLDRLVYPGARDRFEARLHLTGLLGAATRRNDVDVVILNDAPPQLARAIVTRGRRVFCADSEADHAFVRTTLLRAADLEPFLRRARTVKLSALKR